jgi:hypothetical protein
MHDMCSGSRLNREFVEAILDRRDTEGMIGLLGVDFVLILFGSRVEDNRRVFVVGFERENKGRQWCSWVRRPDVSGIPVWAKV